MPTEADQYFASVERAIGRHAELFAFEAIETVRCFADHRYQRHPIPKFIAEIVANFNPLLLQTATLSQRSDGTYAIVDGLQRIEALRVLEVERVPALVYTDLTFEQEARMFAELARMRRRLRPLQDFLAMVAAKDPDSTAILALVKSKGIELMDGGGRTGSVGAVRALEAVYRSGGVRTGPEALDATLETLVRSWVEVPGAMDGTFIRALGMVYQAFTFEELPTPVVIDALRDSSPREIRLTAAAALDAKEPGVTRYTATARAFLRVLVEKGIRPALDERKLRMLKKA